MKKEKEDKAVYLPAELYERVKERSEATDFGSIEEYVTFVLQEVLKEEEPEEIALDREQEKEVKKRLRALGYLD
ncbi:MAG: CopG family transcriptional regulator [Dehalococcoidia bacterium]|nr:CopG family transcriptional regulator [Dehalococcoidia bacterium]